MPYANRFPVIGDPSSVSGAPIFQAGVIDVAAEVSVDISVDHQT
jgi:hypothetical protein